MWMSDFAAFARGSICSTFIDSVPLIEIARAASTVEMALSVLMDRKKEWEDSLTKRFGVPLDGEVGLPKMIGAFCVMSQCSLDVEGSGFREDGTTPDASTWAAGVEQAGGRPPHGHGGAEQGVGGGQREILGRGA